MDAIAHIAQKKLTLMENRLAGSTIQDGIQANPGNQGYFILVNFTKQLWWEKGGGNDNKVHAQATGKLHVCSIKK